VTNRKSDIIFLSNNLVLENCFRVPPPPGGRAVFQDQVIIKNLLTGLMSACGKLYGLWPFPRAKPACSVRRTDPTSRVNWEQKNSLIPNRSGMGNLSLDVFDAG